MTGDHTAASVIQPELLGRRHWTKVLIDTLASPVPHHEIHCEPSSAIGAKKTFSIPARPHGLHSFETVLIEFTVIVTGGAERAESAESLRVGDLVPVTSTCCPR
jgi:hypothetical protein